MNTHTFKEKLEEELKTLETELKTVGRINPNNPGDWEATPGDVDVTNADPNDVADNMEEYEGHTAILKQLEIRYNEVKTALERIKNNTFGMCTVCHAKIEEKRLEANPAATTCIQHKEEQL